jgi:plastocyanin
MTVASVALALAACGTGSEGEQGATAGESAAAPSEGAAGAAAATGNVIEVKMLTDEQGNNRFDPADIQAKQGDVLRFTLVSGVHNAHFLADSNKTASAPLPKATELLQLPGQTADIPLNFGTGRFYFQCDPHALLGMIGHVTVQ